MDIMEIQGKNASWWLRFYLFNKKLSTFGMVKQQLPVGEMVDAFMAFLLSPVRIRIMIYI
jgi:hypothetical protein